MYKNKKNSLYKVIFSILIIAMFSICTIYLSNTEGKNTAVTNSNALSNQKIGWGIKRNNNNEQPDVGKKNQSVLEQNNGICLGNKEKKVIYLTFDEGYEAGYTSKILEVLKQNDVKATFFITAHYLNTQEQLVKQMLEEGHIVGNHTVNHKSMPSLSDEQVNTEVMKLHQSIYEKFAYEMKYIRPPMGEYSERTLNITKSLGYKTVMWSFAYKDWDEKNQPDELKAKEMVISNLHNGEIMLLHGNSKTNTNILDSIIKEIKNKGYEIKSLDEFE